jgi:hypothetical protein
MENITLGIVYHNTVLGKRYLDTLGLGPDMILYFLGNAGTVPFALSKCVLQGSIAASGSVIVEKGIIDVYTFGETWLEESTHNGTENYDFNKNWNMKKNSSYDKALFHNLVAYLKGK